MRLSKLKENVVDRKISTAIRSKEGRKLINPGTKISNRVLDRLKKFGLNAIYIEDENTDIELKETLSKENRSYIVAKLNDIYKNISRGNFQESELKELIKKKIMPQINNEPINLPIGEILSEDDLAGHSLNVCLISITTATKIGMTKEKIESIAKASLLHDIGKLIKNGNQGHEEKGFEFLKGHASSVLVYTTVRYHHETIDGKGPQKQPEEYQHDMVKIISLTNYYENLLRKEKLLPHEAFERVQSLVNTKFDKKIYESFKESSYIYPVGLPVKLSNNEEGIIVRQTANYPLRPMVRTEAREYNLLEELSVFIEEVSL